MNDPFKVFDHDKDNAWYETSEGDETLYVHVDDKGVVDKAQPDKPRGRVFYMPEGGHRWLVRWETCFPWGWFTIYMVMWVTAVWFICDRVTDGGNVVAGMVLLSMAVLAYLTWSTWYYEHDRVNGAKLMFAVMALCGLRVAQNNRHANRAATYQPLGQPLLPPGTYQNPPGPVPEWRNRNGYL